MQPGTWLPPGGDNTGIISAWSSYGEMAILAVFIMILIFLIIQWYFPRAPGTAPTQRQILVLVLSLVIFILVFAGIILLLNMFYVHP